MTLRIYCPSCSGELRTDSDICPTCGVAPDIGETRGHHFLSMEYIKGEELSSLMRRGNTNFTAWYASGFVIELLIVLAIAIYAFYTSLAGQSVFSRKLLED